MKCSSSYLTRESAPGCSLTKGTHYLYDRLGYQNLYFSIALDITVRKVDFR